MLDFQRNAMRGKKLNKYWEKLLKEVEKCTLVGEFSLRFFFYFFEKFKTKIIIIDFEKSCESTWGVAGQI